MRVIEDAPVGIPRDERGADRASPNASRFLSKGQLSTVLLVLAGAVVGAILAPLVTLTIVTGICMLFYVLTASLKLLVSVAGRKYRPLRRLSVKPDDPALPCYGVLLPVHKEANMLRHLVARISRLDYPKELLRVLLLIEHDDLETLTAARNLGLRFHGEDREPSAESVGHVTVVVVPPGGPKTKPNAMNAAMDLVIAEGCVYCTIYDAEDRPDPDQLLKAVGTFRIAPPDIACLQAELAFWNDDTNWVTALYWIGYKIHFLRFLPGLARMGLPIPLGGTSNHFRVDVLRGLALQPGGEIWDPHNLTEDADLGARLMAAGYRTELLNSRTMEEAPTSSRIVDKQQRRWKGGYLQTGLVYTRHPFSTARRMGPVKWFSFILMMLGTPLSFILNPLFLGLTVAFFLTRSEIISRLFPAAIYYPGLALLILGNFALLYELVLTCLEEAEHTRGRYSLLKHMLLAQLMWLWISRSTYIAVFELCIGKRAWHKTPHGLEVADDEFEVDSVPPPAMAARQPQYEPHQRVYSMRQPEYSRPQTLTEVDPPQIAAPWTASVQTASMDAALSQNTLIEDATSMRIDPFAHPAPDSRLLAHGQEP
jgi:cellulose synthase/poly-beta-1,6-N-acetylglucosamine synthase-like glycosyltransferase